MSGEVRDHRCQALERSQKRGRDPVEVRFYGHAIDVVFYDPETGRWYASNEKYATPIAFCPFCGLKLIEERG